MERTNLHATALVTGARGVLVLGASGAGKSTLALHLIARCRAAGVFAAFVSDDRTWVSERGGRLLAEVPPSIAGLVEVRGYGPAPIAHEPRAIVDLVVRLVAAPEAPRHRDDAVEIIQGISVPALILASGNASAAADAVMARLGLDC